MERDTVGESSESKPNLSLSAGIVLLTKRRETTCRTRVLIIVCK